MSTIGLETSEGLEGLGCQRVQQSMGSKHTGFNSESIYLSVSKKSND